MNTHWYVLLLLPRDEPRQILLPPNIRHNSLIQWWKSFLCPIIQVCPHVKYLHYLLELHKVARQLKLKLLCCLRPIVDNTIIIIIIIIGRHSGALVRTIASQQERPGSGGCLSVCMFSHRFSLDTPAYLPLPTFCNLVHVTVRVFLHCSIATFT